MDVSREKEEGWDEGIGEGRASLMGQWMLELTLTPYASTLEEDSEYTYRHTYGGGGGGGRDMGGIAPF